MICHLGPYTYVTSSTSICPIHACDNVGTSRRKIGCIKSECLHSMSNLSIQFIFFCTFVKVGTFYMVFMDEDVGREAYNVSDQAFSSEEDALRASARKTNLRSQLLSFCQVRGNLRSLCGHELTVGGVAQVSVLVICHSPSLMSLQWLLVCCMWRFPSVDLEGNQASARAR